MKARANIVLLTVITAMAVALVPAGRAEAATPPQGTAVPKPPELALRLPWKAGERHSNRRRS